MDASQTLDISVGGMTCASCVGRVERALGQVEGVRNASVNLATETARVTAEASEGLEARLRRAVRVAGYEPRLADADAATATPSPWQGFAPVALGLVLCAPLLAPMALSLFGRSWMPSPWLQL